MPHSNTDTEPTGVRKKPIQQRSQASLDRLLDATEEILLEKKFADILVADIVKRAKSSVGVFYSRFRDKADILIALQDREDERSAELTKLILDPEKWRGIPPEYVIRGMVSELVDRFRKRRHVIAPVVGLYLADPVRFRENPVKKSLEEGVTAVLVERAQDINHPDPQTAALAGLGMIFAFLEHLVVVGDEPYGGLTLDDPRLSEELSRMVLLYLGIRSIPSSASS